MNRTVSLKALLQLQSSASNDILIRRIGGTCIVVVPSLRRDFNPAAVARN